MSTDGLNANEAKADEAKADEQMDARLQAAGARWRASATASARGGAAGTAAGFVPPADEPLPVITPDRRSGRRLWTSIAGGIVAAAAVAAGLVWLAGGQGAGPAQPEEGDQHASAISIAQIHWRLVALVDAHGNRTDPARPATFFLDPDNTQFPLLASDGCNALSGSATLAKSAPAALRIGDLGTTLMAFPPRNRTRSTRSCPAASATRSPATN